MNLTGGVLANRPPGKPLDGLFGERVSTDKRLVGVYSGNASVGPAWLQSGPSPGLPLTGISALQEKEVSPETGRRPQESSDALQIFRVKSIGCQRGSAVKNVPAMQDTPGTRVWSLDR